MVAVPIFPVTLKFKTDPQQKRIDFAGIPVYMRTVRSSVSGYLEAGYGNLAVKLVLTFRDIYKRRGQYGNNSFEAGKIKFTRHH